MDINGPGPNKYIQGHENRHEEGELLEFTTQAHKQEFQYTSHDVRDHTNAPGAATGETTACNTAPHLNVMNTQSPRFQDLELHSRKG